MLEKSANGSLTESSAGIENFLAASCTAYAGAGPVVLTAQEEQSYFTQAWTAEIPETSRTALCTQYKTDPAATVQTLIAAEQSEGLVFTPEFLNTFLTSKC